MQLLRDFIFSSRKSVANRLQSLCKHALTELTKKGQRNQDIKWGESKEKAFNQLRKALVSKPILKMVEISKPFTLQVDASDLGIGAIVLQEENGKKVPVA